MIHTVSPLAILASYIVMFTTGMVFMAKPFMVASYSRRAMKQNFQILYSNNHIWHITNINNIIMIMYIIQIWYVFLHNHRHR